MKTDDFIELLAQDAAPQWSFGTLFNAALGAGILIAGTAFLATIGMRPDIAHAAETVRFLMKFVVTLPLAVGAVGLIQAMARPGALRGPWPWLVLAAPLLLAAAVVVELAVVPHAAWMTRLVGVNAAFCLGVIPFLALGPLACFLLVLRRGAPAHPGPAGAVAGLAAGAIGATFYASHCPDDSPLFVAVWYTLAITAVTGIGYLGGRSLLRW